MTKPVLIEIDHSMLEPVEVPKDPSIGNEMLTEDLVTWWIELRSAIEKANSKLVSIQEWYVKQRDLLIEEK